VKLLFSHSLVTLFIVNANAATTITSNQSGTIDGYNYSLWKDNGTTSMTLNGGGKFNCSWSNINNALFRIGKNFDSTKKYQQIGNITENYSCDYKPNGNSYLAVYGWTKSPLIEYYVVDSWGSWRPPGSSSKGTITIDGGTYDIYETTRTNQPSIEGNKTFQQFWSVRTSKRTSGTISVSEHFKAWENKGMKLGNLTECALTVEGYQSSGSANITNNTMSIGGTPSSPTNSKNPSPTSTSNSPNTSTPKPSNNSNGWKWGNWSFPWWGNSNSNSPTVKPSNNNNTIPTKSPQPSTLPNSNGKFHVFLLLGQSNMAGYPKALDSDKVKNERIRVLDYNSNQWRVAVPPLHETWQGAIGPGDWFSKTIVNKIPSGDTIGLVPCAISGEKIETFMKSGGSKYNWIIDRAKLAQQAGGNIEGILFHQGESNNGDTSWPGKVNTLVENLRTDLKTGSIPFIAGELLYSGGCAGHNTLVNKLPSVVKNCYVVSANGLVVDPSDTQYRLHFSHDSQVTLGKRYAEKMISALGW